MNADHCSMRGFPVDRLSAEPFRLLLPSRQPERELARRCPRKKGFFAASVAITDRSLVMELTLTGDLMVTYSPCVTDDDQVFKALADPTRRFLLDLLFQRDGRTLKELESGLDMTRFGVMKHLRVLEDAGLVVTRRSGREKLHFLNAVPIRLIHDRWIDKYREREVSALVALKTELEKKD
jgi:DNA-binding transcriptional ArsR family regulator